MKTVACLIGVLALALPINANAVGVTVSSGALHLPSQRYIHSAAYASNTDKIYIFGGTDNNAGKLDEIVEFNPFTGSTSILSVALPSARERTSAVYAPNTGKIYVFGGEDVSYHPLADIVEFSPLDNSISTLSVKLSTGVRGVSASYAPNTGKIYIFGGLAGVGVEGVTVSSTITQFDPVTNSISTLPITMPLSRALSPVAYAPSNGKIYIFGGYYAGQQVYYTCDEVFEFDPLADSITTLPVRLPQKMGSIEAFYLPKTGLIYIPGGLLDMGEISTIRSFDPESKVFATLSVNLPYKLAGMSSLYVPDMDVAYVIGGSTGSTMQLIDDIIEIRFYELLPPSGLTASLVEGLKVRLDWLPSPSANAASYNIYWDAGTGAIDYTARLSSVSAALTSYVTESLSTGTYRFAIRAQADNGAIEGNPSVVASVTVPLVPDTVKPRAVIKVPHSGKKIGGNRVTVMAEIIQGSLSQVKQVEFQYRSAASTTTPWISIVAANENHPNPDTVSPYFTHWNVTSIAPGNYELQAVTMDIYGSTDTSPSTIVVTIDNTNPDTEEKVVGGIFQKREVVFNTIPQTLKAGDLATNSITQVTLPVGAVTSSSTTLKVIVNPAGAPNPPSDLTPCSQVREITLENGQTTLNSPATLTFQYQDSDNDGLVDGALARADKLAIYAYDPVSGKWKKESISAVDTGNKTVTAQTSHFSLFGMFAPAATDLSDVLVYPVPWVPNDGNTDNGKPYNSADPTSGIVFDNITQSAKIQIFTITGELVWEKSTDTSSGKVQWDGKNNSGRNAASGGYFTVITDTATGSRVTRKIAIIR